MEAGSNAEEVISPTDSCSWCCTRLGFTKRLLASCEIRLCMVRTETRVLMMSRKSLYGSNSEQRFQSIGIQKNDCNEAFQCRMGLWFLESD